MCDMCDVMLARFGVIFAKFTALLLGMLLCLLCLCLCLLGVMFVFGVMCVCLVLC